MLGFGIQRFRELRVRFRGRSSIGFKATVRRTKKKATAALWVSIIKGLKERPSEGPLGLKRGFMRLYKGYTMVI